MKEIIYNFFSNIGHQLAVALLMGTAAITTGTAITKLTTKPKNIEAMNSSSEASTSATPTPQIIDQIVTEYVTVTPSITPMSSPNPTPASIRLDTVITENPNTQQTTESFDDDEDGEDQNEEVDEEMKMNQKTQKMKTKLLLLLILITVNGVGIYFRIRRQTGAKTVMAMRVYTVKTEPGKGRFTVRLNGFEQYRKR